MFAVLYTLKIKPGKEMDYQTHWTKVASFFKQHKGALGSILHKAEDGKWIAYSQWPDRAYRDAAWPQNKEDLELLNYPQDIHDAIFAMHDCVEMRYPEICMEVREDLLCTNPS
jgi:hypothetical protein